MQKILVTGSDGRIGRVVVADLQQHGYTVTPADLHPTQPWDAQIVDFEDLGQVVSVMHGHDAVVHLAAIPRPTRHPAEVVFRNNMMSLFNVLEAATILGIKKLVLASSLSALGFAYEHRHFNPTYVPIDEVHPLLSQDVYGLVKQVGEDVAAGFVRRTPDMCIASLRITTVIDDYLRPSLTERRITHPLDCFLESFGTYVDVRDTAAACRLALENSLPGHEAYNITAPDIYIDAPVEALLEQAYPGGDYPVAAHIRGNISPVDSSKAERQLGWRARYSWDGSEL